MMPPTDDANTRPTGEPAAPPTRLRMAVEGMTCTDCERHVERALQEAGATGVDVDFRRGDATFTVRGTPDEAALTAAVAATGYRPGAVDPQRSAATVATTTYRPGAVEPVAAGRRGTRPAGGGDGHRYDLAIVGSGGGAFAAAITAVERGARVVMIERGTLGGTCVNVGCVPSKTQLRAGERFWHAGHQPFLGIRTRAEAVDLPALIGQKDDLVRGLRREKYADLIDEYGWELVRGEAAFSDPGTLRVGDRAIRADGLVLATGARPAVPPIDGLHQIDYLTSTSLLDLQRLPEHLLVVGAGYVGLELGQLFRHLGSRVTVMQRGERLLRESDPEISEAVHGFLTGEGIDAITGATFLRAEQAGGRRRLLIRVQGEERWVEGDALLVATERTPNTEALNLAAAGVAVGHWGEIVIDDRLRTSNPRVFAAGDVTLGPQYVYVAAHEGAVAAENALGGSRMVDLRAVPGVTFTTPAIATVGLTEEAARQAGRTPKASTLPLHAVPRALVNRDERGVFKVVADAQTDEVLGVHVVAENAGDVIYAGVLAVKFHLTVRDLTETFAPYLTMSEGLKLAAQTFGRDIAKLSCCGA
jgi:mercuric reductase